MLTKELEDWVPAKLVLKTTQKILKLNYGLIILLGILLMEKRKMNLLKL